VWIIFIIVLCIALTVTSLRHAHTTGDIQVPRQEPTINVAALPDVGADGPPLSRGEPPADR
jgi:hypothetical protein